MHKAVLGIATAFGLFSLFLSSEPTWGMDQDEVTVLVIKHKPSVYYGLPRSFTKEESAEIDRKFKALSGPSCSCAECVVYSIGCSCVMGFLGLVGWGIYEFFHSLVTG